MHIHNLRSLNLAVQLTHRHRHTGILIIIIPPFLPSLFLSKLIPIELKRCTALFSLGFPFTCEMEFREFKTAAVERDEWGELSRGRSGVGYGGGGFGFGFGRGCSGWKEVCRVLFLQRVSVSQTGSGTLGKDIRIPCSCYTARQSWLFLLILKSHTRPDCFISLFSVHDIKKKKNVV